MPRERSTALEAQSPRGASPAREAVKAKRLSPRTIAITVAMLLLVSAAGAAYWRLARAVDVPVAVARQGAIATRVIGPGTVQARISVTLGTRISATIMHVHADVGPTRCAPSSCWSRSTIVS